MPPWNVRITLIIRSGTPKRAITFRSSVRSTEWYTVCRSVKRTCNGVLLICSTFCMRSAYDGCHVASRSLAPESVLFSGRILASWTNLSGMLATILKSTLLACATTEMPPQKPHSALSFFSTTLWPLRPSTLTTTLRSRWCYGSSTGRLQAPRSIQASGVQHVSRTFPICCHSPLLLESLPFHPRLVGLQATERLAVV